MLQRLNAESNVLRTRRIPFCVLIEDKFIEPTDEFVRPGSHVGSRPAHAQHFVAVSAAGVRTNVRVHIGDEANVERSIRERQAGQPSGSRTSASCIANHTMSAPDT